MTIKDIVTRPRTPAAVWGLRLSIVAAFMYMIMKSGIPLTGYEVIVAGLALGGAALVFEYVGAHRMAVAWFERSPAAIFGWGLIWLGAFIFSANNWLGAASDGEAGKANIQKAAFVSYDDGRKAVDDTRARVLAEQKSLADLEAMTWQPLPKIGSATVSSSGAAKAILDAAKDGTNRHTQAKRAYEDLLQRERWQEDIRKAKAQLADARAKHEQAREKAATTKVATSDARTDLRFYTAYLGVDTEKAGDLQAALRIFAVSLFISLFAWLHTAEQYKGKPRKPWLNIGSIAARARRAWDGTDHTVVNNNVYTAHAVRGPNGVLGATAVIPAAT